MRRLYLVSTARGWSDRVGFGHLALYGGALDLLVGLQPPRRLCALPVDGPLG